MDRRHFVGAAWAAGAGLMAPLAAQGVSVTEFGVAGDGVRDDTEGIQRAVLSGAASLFFPTGTYRITKTILIDMTAAGYAALAGAGTACLLAECEGPAFHFLGTHTGTADPESVKDPVWQRERMPLVSGVEIRGAHPRAEGICLEKTMMATLTGVLIRRCRVGVHLKTRNRNLIVSHCHIYDNDEIGIWFDHVDLHQTNLSANHISYNKVAGIKIAGGAVRNLQITGNDIEYNHDEKGEGSADVFFDLREEDSTFRESTIASNTIQARISPGGANIRILGGPGLRTSGMLAITGNLIGSQTDNIHLVECRGVSISGNAIYSAADHSLLLEDSANVVVDGNSIDWNPDHEGKQLVDGITIRRCRGVQVTGCIIENSFHGSPEAGGTIEIEHSEDVAVSQCQILDPRYRGVCLVDAKRCRLSDNTIIDRRPQVSMIHSISVDEKSRDNMITGNLLHRGKHAVPRGTCTWSGNKEIIPRS